MHQKSSAIHSKPHCSLNIDCTGVCLQRACIRMGSASSSTTGKPPQAWRANAPILASLPGVSLTERTRVRPLFSTALGTTPVLHPDPLLKSGLSCNNKNEQGSLKATLENL